MRRPIISMEELDRSQLESLASFIEEHETIQESETLHKEIYEDLKQLHALQEEFHQELDSDNKENTSTTESIATENFIDTVKTIWQKIVEFLKIIINKIRMFFDKHFGVLQRRRSYVEKLQTRLKEMKSGTKTYVVDDEKNIVLNEEESHFFTIVENKDNVSIKTVLDTKSIKHEIENLENINRNIFTDYIKIVLERAEIIEGILPGFINNPEALSSELNSKFEHLHLSSFNESTFNGIVFKEADKKSLTDISHELIEIEDHSHEHIKNGREIKMFSIEDSIEMLSLLIKLIDQVQEYKDHQYSKVLRLQKELENKTNAVVKSVNDKTEELTSEQKNLFTKMVKFNTGFIDQIKKPTMLLVDLNTKAVFHICNLIEKNMKLFKKDKALNIYDVLGLDH